MKYQTRISKGREGWEAHTNVPLEGDTIAEGDRFLKVSTYKGSKGLVTTVTCCTKTDVGYVFAMYQDYMKTVMQSKTRCTEKSVEVQHTAVLNDMDFILSDVRIHYMKEVAA